MAANSSEYVSNLIGATAMEPIDQDLQELVHRFFPRARVGDEAMIMKTTTELHAILDEHMPGRWSADQVATTMDAGGYERRLVADELRWLVLPKG